MSETTVYSSKSKIVEKPLVHWLCDSPSPYNAQLFQALAREQDYELVVHYRRLALGSHPWQSSLTAGYTSREYQTWAGVDWTLLRHALRRTSGHQPLAFVVGGWNHPTAWLLLLVLGLRRSNFMLWTDTPNLMLKRAGLRQTVRQRFLRWAFRRARYVMGTGIPAVQALEAMGAPADQLVNFPYWIDVERYTVATAGRKLRGHTSRPVVFLSSGLIENARKGHHVAVRALVLAAQRGDRAFEYRIAGAGPDEAALRKLAEDLEIGDRVKLLGWLEPDALIAQLGEADVFIHPSPVHEPYGVAVLEAMAAGLPVLASEVTCAGLDRIEPGVNGCLHPAGNSEALAAQILALLKAPGRLEAMGAAALRTAREWPLTRGARLIRRLILGEHRA